jgi:hypothetical protein
MSHQDYTAFLDDARGISSAFKPKTSSLWPLVKFLQDNEGRPVEMSYTDARNMIAPRDLGPGGRFLKYIPAVNRLVSVWGTRKDYPTRERIERYAAAYPKARFWHGVKMGGDMAAIYEAGLLTSKSASEIGAADPGMREPIAGAKGPIFLAYDIKIAQDYGKHNGIFRVFLNATRTQRPWSAPRGFIDGDVHLWHDSDNANAVLTMADIPGANLLWGSHRDQLLNNLDSVRSRTIAMCIASHDQSLPQDPASCANLHRFAVESGMIKDALEQDTFKDVKGMFGR